MKISDLAMGVLLALVSIAVLIHIQSFPPMPGQKVNAAFFPGVIAAGLLLCATLLIWRGWRGWRSEPHAKWFSLLAWMRSRAHRTLMMVFVASVIAYIYLLDILGFIPCSIALLALMMHLLGVRLGRAAVLAVVVTFIMHYLFYKLLRVPLPWGLLAPWAW